MNTEFSDWLIHLKPKAMRESKGKQHPQNKESKEQPIDLDPSKAWIKNKGAGTTTQLPRFKTKRDNVLVTATTMSSSLPASTSSPPPAMTPTNTRNNKSATASQASNEKYSQDKWMALLQQISDTSIDESADSSEQTLVNASCDTDGSNYETCIEIDETLVGATDVKPTKPAPTQSKAMDITTNQRFKNFPLELTNADLHDEISLYEGMGTIDWMSSRVTDPEMLAQELSTLKHEQSEHLDDTLISEMVPNGLDDSIRPSRIHELSIPLGPFDFPSTSSLSATALSLPPSNLSSREIKSESILQSQQLDSTSISATNFAEIDEKKSILREKIWNECKQISIERQMFLFLEFIFNYLLFFPSNFSQSEIQCKHSRCSHTI